MMSHTRFLLAATAALAMLASFPAMAEPTMVFLVRHAEKAKEGKDPALTEAGRERARNLAAMLGKAGIAHIFSSTTTRTRQTAEPLAQASGVAVELYDPKMPEALVARVRALDGAVLVVGHSNTLPELVRLFGGQPGADIGDNEYDRLYQLVRGPDGAVATVRLRSLPVSGGQ